MGREKASIGVGWRGGGMEREGVRRGVWRERERGRGRIGIENGGGWERRERGGGRRGMDSKWVGRERAGVGVG